MDRESLWGWPVACYLFFGGVGGGLATLSTVTALFNNNDFVNHAGVLVSAILLVSGSGVLIFELGRPWQFWRVFSKQNAVMTIGAWMLAFLIVVELIYLGVWDQEIVHVYFNLSSGVIRSLFVWGIFSLGIGVTLYTGILLGSMRARPFWYGPVLPFLFLISSISTGLAAQFLIRGYAGGNNNSIGLTAGQHHWWRFEVGVLILEICVVFIFLMSKYASGSRLVQAMVMSWFNGKKSYAFWLGWVGIGIFLPLFLFVQRGPTVAASICILAGGLIMRLLVVYTSDSMPMHTFPSPRIDPMISTYPDRMN